MSKEKLEEGGRSEENEEGQNFYDDICEKISRTKNVILKLVGVNSI